MNVSERSIPWWAGRSLSSAFPGTFAELDQIRKLEPAILNGLPSDTLYDETLGSEPQRNKEFLQSWDALKAMLVSVSKGALEEKLDICRKQIKTAEALYDKLQVSVQFEPKSNAG